MRFNIGEQLAKLWTLRSARIITYVFAGTVLFFLVLQLVV